MKNNLYKLISIATICSVLITGCGNGGDNTAASKNSGKNNTDKVLEEQVSKSKQDTAADIINGKQPIETPFSPEDNYEDTAGENENKTAGIDIDLTTMGSDMIYATVYQMMMSPDEYVGKTIRMNGTYSANYFEATKQYYHSCIIKDATACCSQGIEFVWDDGSHVYPDEYPQEGADITVTGVFETYREDGDDTLYCRLNNSTLEKAAK